MNTEQARINMIKQQIRTNAVVDDAVLQVLETTPREQFVPEAYKGLAFADTNIPLDHDQQMMIPQHEAQMIEYLTIRKTDSILEIGTGTGYVTALLAQLGKHVETIDIFEDFTTNAQEKLQALDLNNVTYTTADAAAGWDKKAPYDVIAITGSVPYLPKAFKESLAINGRLFAVVGQAPAMCATLVTRHSDDAFSSQPLFETDIKPLINAQQKERFIF